MQSLTSQFFAFLVMVLIGLIVGVSFDIYNVTKTVLRPRRIFVMAGDVFFWVVTTINVIFLLLVGNWGEIRLYVIIGAAIGALIYFKFMRENVIKAIIFILKVAGRILSILHRLIRFIVLVIAYPFLLVKRIIAIPLGILGKFRAKTSSLLAKTASKLRQNWASLFKR